MSFYVIHQSAARLFVHDLRHHRPRLGVEIHFPFFVFVKAKPDFRLELFTRKVGEITVAIVKISALFIFNIHQTHVVDKRFELLIDTTFAISETKLVEFRKNAFGRQDLYRNRRRNGNFFCNLSTRIQMRALR